MCDLSNIINLKILSSYLRVGSRPVRVRTQLRIQDTTLINKDNSYQQQVPRTVDVNRR